MLNVMQQNNQQQFLTTNELTTLTNVKCYNNSRTTSGIELRTCGLEISNDTNCPMAAICQKAFLFKIIIINSTFNF